MVGSSAYLDCGMVNDDGDEHAFGYRHIKDRHQDDWQSWASRVGRGWQDLAGWAIDGALENPSKVENQSASRFCYSRKVYYRVDGEAVDYFYSRIYLGESGRRITTAFPGQVPCRGENIL